MKHPKHTNPSRKVTLTMKLHELHTINTNFICPYNTARKIRKDFCHRDEIASPKKLSKLQSITSTNTSNAPNAIYCRNNRFFYSFLIPWQESYTSYGVVSTSVYFRILCQKPSMFKVELDAQNVNEWFNEYHDSMFLVTHVVMENEHGCRYISKNGECVELTNYAPHSDEEMDVILDERCYTIANGLTFVLAMHRIGVLPTHSIMPSLTGHFDNLILDYYQQVKDTWEELYYANTSDNIADHPLYYVCTGPDFADDEVVTIFKNAVDINIILKTTNAHTTFTSPQTAMLPHFSLNHWLNHDQSSLWRNWEVPNVAVIGGFIAMLGGAEPYICPDFFGIVGAFVCNDEGWTYWQEHNRIILGYLLNPLSARRRRLLELLKSLFHVYTYTECDCVQHRLQTVWRQALSHLYDVKMIVETSIMMYMYLYITNDHTPPLAYISDILEISDGTIVLDEVCICGRASVYLMDRILQHFPTADLTRYTNHVCSYKASTSFYKMIHLDDAHVRLLHKMLMARMLGIRHITDAKNSKDGYIAYIVVMEYIRNNRHLLF